MNYQETRSTCFTLQNGLETKYFSMTTSISGEDVLSVLLTFFLLFSISGSNTVQQRTMIAGSSMSLHTNKEWKALPPLGPYYGKTWYIEGEGEGAFDPVINRTPAQAAAARLMPKPPNLETYAAALSRDQMDKTVVL
jgi:hypothetical protein